MNEYECRACFSRDLSFIETVIINSKPNYIYRCNSCNVIINVGLDNDDIHLQEESSKSYYSHSIENVNIIHNEIKRKKLLIQSLGYYLKNNRSILEIGFGNGLLLIGASELGFKKIYGVDLNIETFSSVKKTLGKQYTNIFVYRDINELNDKVEVLFLWHLLEHIYKPNTFIRSILPRLSDGAFVIIQVPQYAKKHVCGTHYYFYDEISIIQLLRTNRIFVTDICYIPYFHFMTVIARYNIESPLNSKYLSYKHFILNRPYLHFAFLSISDIVKTAWLRKLAGLRK